MKTLITVYNSNLKKVAFNPEAIKKLQAVSEVVWVEEGPTYTVEELARDIRSFDACITCWDSPKFTPQVLANAGHLKFIGHAAGTVMPIVDRSIFETEIVVTNANSALAQSTAELAVTLLMAGAWNIHGYHERMKEGGWSEGDHETVPGLNRQSIGLIGYGDISREVIRLLQPYHPEIRLCSAHCTAEEAAALGVELAGLEELMKKSRIVSLHNTLTPATRGMIGKKELSWLQDGALLVNTARSPIVDGNALLSELRSGRISAAIDVYDHEPLDRKSALLKLPNVLCTPHIGGFSGYWRTRLGETVIDDLVRFVNGQPLRGQITVEKFDRLTPM